MLARAASVGLWGVVKTWSASASSKVRSSWRTCNSSATRAARRLICAVAQSAEDFTIRLERALDQLPQVLWIRIGDCGVVSDPAECADEGGGHEAVVSLDLGAIRGAPVEGGHGPPRRAGRGGSWAAFPAADSLPEHLDGVAEVPQHAVVPGARVLLGTCRQVIELEGRALPGRPEQVHAASLGDVVRPVGSRVETRRAGRHVEHDALQVVRLGPVPGATLFDPLR